ncbi:tetratricopeptide repeat protein [Amycolatopsis sp. cg9]|uniref:SEL1-like repeat protein n=1 Tax=Amycolatopsis sp. cg9 TaxID=3238801 RepID=UPI0035265B0B
MGKVVADVSLEELRVHAAVVDIPYVSRAVKEREVGDHLRARRPVLIVGPSMVGKTRLAAATIGRTLRDKLLLLPDSPSALGDLEKAEIIPRQHVIWLDDLERFLVGGCVTAGLVQRFCESNWVVATLRAHEWDRFQPTDQLRPPEWDVLRLFNLVLLDRDLDRPTEEDLRRAIPDEDIRGRIIRIGIGEYVGAAQHVLDQLAVGKNASPLGYALVVGAADWSLMGITRPVPRALLRRLAALRLSGRRRSELDDEKKYSAALEWATREINPTVSLLEPVGGAAFRVYDLALEQLAAAGRSVPIAAWKIAVDVAAVSELTSIGYQALVLHDLPEVAELAWRKAAEAGNCDAMNNLGLLLQNKLELTEAECWYRQAVEIGNVEAMNNLAALLQKRGGSIEAEHWYLQAAEAGLSGAMSNLGALLQKQQKFTEAERWYGQAARAGHPSAMNFLGVLLQNRGKIAEADLWYRQAAEIGHPVAMKNLGFLLQSCGDSTGADFWYQKAANATLAGAMLNLGALLQKCGEQVEAEGWFRRAAAIGNVDAMNNLGTLLQKRGQLTESERWYREASKAGHPSAMANLGGLLNKRHEPIGSGPCD